MEDRKVHRHRNTIKKRAKRKNQEFNLTAEDFKDMRVKRCPHLGCKLIYKSVHRGEPTPYNLATVDRIDNKKGYVKNNVQILSFKANQIKSVKEQYE